MVQRLDRQKTIAEPITLRGIGVHSGDPASVSLYPAEAGSGIVFQGRDGARGRDVEIPAHWKSVSATSLCTVLGDPKAGGVATVEHLMAALRGLGVDNVTVEMDGPEMPIMDGSSAAFVAAIDGVGLKSLTASRRYIKIMKPVRITSGDAWCELLPYDGTRFEVTIDFPSAAIGCQSIDIDLTPDVFRRELARARTFGSVADVERLWENGFALGSSLENSVAIADDKVVNPEGIRWPDEFVRHKTLDAVGDLALAGLPILGHFRSYKGGHRMNHAILVELFENSGQGAFQIAVAPQVREASSAELVSGLSAAAFGPSVS